MKTYLIHINVLEKTFCTLHLLKARLSSFCEMMFEMFLYASHYAYIPSTEYPHPTCALYTVQSNDWHANRTKNSGAKTVDSFHSRFTLLLIYLNLSRTKRIKRSKSMRISFSPSRNCLRCSIRV